MTIEYNAEFGFSFAIKDFIETTDKLSIRSVNYILILFQYSFTDFGNCTLAT